MSSFELSWLGRRLGASMIALVAAHGLACSSNDDGEPAAIGGSTASSGGTAGSGAASGGSTSTGGNAGSAPASGGAAGASGSSGGSGGSATSSGGAAGSAGMPATCGDGVAEGSEPCDGTSFASTCVDYGFEEGTLACSDDCKGITTGCSGTERCYDGRDNDGDDLQDCLDDDCQTACAMACHDNPLLADPGEAAGNTLGHAASSDLGCAELATGSEVHYTFRAKHTGMLDVELSSGAPLLLGVRTSCGDAMTDLGCTPTGKLKLPITAGDTVFVVIDGATTQASGSYELSARSRPIQCGDAIRDPGEGCDDGNEVDGDGCNTSCTVESSESEPNDSLETADALTLPFFGEIAGGDADVIAVTTTEPIIALSAEVVDFGDGACAAGELDSVVEILGSTGQVLAEDDDGGDNLCSLALVQRTSASPLPAGDYFVRITASEFGFTSEFPYVVNVIVNLCGNGIVSPGEQCDDGNLFDADGCSSSCRDE